MKNTIDPPKRVHRPEKSPVDLFPLRRPTLLSTDESKSTSSNRTNISSGLEQYAGDWGHDEVIHLLRRTLFGVWKSEIETFLTLNVSDAVDTILTPESIWSPPVNDYQSFLDTPDPDVDEGETWITAPYNGEIEYMRILSLKSWILEQMHQQSTSIHHKLGLFWHNLLPTEMTGVFIAKSGYKYYRMLLDNAFGNYKDLIKKLTIDPNMLFYLNGTYNHKNAPDENYARELQELFCIGKGPNSGYTEGDVQAAARVLTGWVIIGDSIWGEGEPTSVFADSVISDPNNYWHEESDKQFSEFYGNQVISGRSGADGAQELDDLLDMIFDQKETSLYICRRIYNFFVYHDIDEVTETNVIEPLAQIFRENNYEIRPVLSALFKSEHFFDAANYGAMIKNPMDHMLGLMRSLEIFHKGLSAESPSDILFRNTSLGYMLNDTGMYVGDPPNVAGWQAYYQEPTFDKIWISSDSILRRTQNQDILINYGYVYGYFFPEFSLINLVEMLDSPDDPQLLAEEASRFFLGIPLTTEQLENLENILDPIGDQWPGEWSSFVNDPDNEMKRNVVESRLRSLFQTMLQLAEFQLM